ncbi:carbamoyltransferase HypF [Asticcacaulis sp. 201]|uniref:carbamoyltransferase HypF n=1 Tax=Asticcacaulis sp. 201 TaxID=3028787 RepID=UPI002916147F|nr:carbamoyltransferase HypF [Asticcacaulis sp. 201]MDV6330621.1 carbamoyltransferase HypF [Asticcacaulis sp. 201]
MCAERIRVRGTVQGVGFRPFVWQLAARFGIRGDVSNDGEGVIIRATGADLEGFVAALSAEAPRLSRIASIERAPIAPFSSAGFTIVETQGGTRRTGITPDAALCSACADEINDPAARRFAYPFTNCTHCGPRFSIIDSIPYDRAATRMRAFTMCAACLSEYSDPADRRFHAQPIACPDCGPHLDRSLEEAVSALKAGKIIAIKGLGGFHLACDATNELAVATLRTRKHRPHKPFAVMVADLDSVRAHSSPTAFEALLLSDQAAPIVLIDGKRGLAPSVAPTLERVGWMLAYTPLHALICRAVDRPLVMTSGNISGEPQVIDNTEALEKLSIFADTFLMHDREIARRLDDSVASIDAGELRVHRRARGFAPAPLDMPHGLRDAGPILALGGELKAAVCLTFGDGSGEAILSHHLGDLEDALTYDEFEKAIDDYTELFDHVPQAIACDLHPQYRSTEKAEALAAIAGVPLIRIQHHHAHIASCMAENGWPADGQKVLGLAFDGAGYGSDGTVWGGEWLVCDYLTFEHVACLKPVALPGGEAAARAPWRNLLAQMVSAFGEEEGLARLNQLGLADALRDKAVAPVSAQIRSGLNSPMTSSAGRLFDAVAAALRLSFDAVSFEGQAAMQLESLAIAGEWSSAYPFATREHKGELCLDPTPMWLALQADVVQGAAAGEISWRFHAGLAQSSAALAAALAQKHGVGTVALSGGVMQNRLLLSLLIEALEGRGLSVLTHRQVPSNDGGLAFGQAAVAAAIIANNSRY